MEFDVIVVGSGPGGYVAAIRASQLGFNTAIVEKEELGGICLNWGCIPTKALLKSAQVFNYIKHSEDFGIEITKSNPNFEKMIKRSRDVADNMSKGIDFLMKKNKITVIKGFGKLMPNNKVEVTNEKKESNIYDAKNIIIATGAKSRVLENIKQDGEFIIGYRKAMSLKKQPKTMTIVGSGAIGVEFAYFYKSIGTEVTIIEYQDNIVPAEDKDISRQLAKDFKKSGIKILTNTGVEKVEVKNKKCKILLNNGEKIESDVVLSAVGIESNISNIGLEDVGIATDNNKIIVDEFYNTNIPGYFAIGDVIKGPALAHVASAEGITCIEKISGMDVQPINYDNIPGCTYCSPEIASVGLTEEQAKEKGYEIKVGKFPFSASGKANAAGHKEGFVKVIFDSKYGEWLGCHMIGYNVTEMVAEVVAARNLETTGHEIIKSIHPHPTMSEAIMEAVAAAYDEVIHI